MERSDDYARLRSQLDKLITDFHSVVSALNSLHSKNESDIERLQESVENLRRELHTLDVSSAVTKADVVRLSQGGSAQELRQMQMDIASLNKDLALLAQRVDTALARPETTGRTVISATPPAPAPAARKSEHPKGFDWTKLAQDIGSKWAPMVAAITALLLSTLQQCGVIKPPPPSAATTPPAATAPRDGGTPAPR